MLSSKELKKELGKLKTDDIKLALYLSTRVNSSLVKYNDDIDRKITTNNSNTCLMLYELFSIEKKVSKTKCKNLKDGETVLQICHLRPKFDLEDIGYMFGLIATSDGWVKVSSYDEEYCLKITKLTNEECVNLKNNCRKIVNDLYSLHGMLDASCNKLFTRNSPIDKHYGELINCWKDITDVKRDFMPYGSKYEFETCYYVINSDINVNVLTAKMYIKLDKFIKFQHPATLQYNPRQVLLSAIDLDNYVGRK